ncbi:MAG: DUF2202 domain-containing protein [Saprospiraceae bacterium]|nr:DUF2202 domain-containing protein [Saprospiraceae bacterium]
MKKQMLLLWVLALIVTPMLLISCAEEDTPPPFFFQVDENGYSNMNRNYLYQDLNNFPKQTLSDTEKASLAFMREEELLARDIYTELYKRYSLPVFNNIANSEQTHTEAVLVLLERYELDDPAENHTTGIFVDQTLQTLYNTLLARGLENEVEALKVGALVEEVDIKDLKIQLAEKVDNQDIIYVYENLMKGSRNHLRAFVKNLKFRGVTYVPEVLSQGDYDAIINGDMERGRS